MNIDQMRQSLPPFLRYRDVQQKLNLPRWIVRRMIADGLVKTHKQPGSRSAVIIDTDSLLAALVALPGATYQLPAVPAVAAAPLTPAVLPAPLQTSSRQKDAQG